MSPFFSFFFKTRASQVASELDAGNDVVIAAGNDIRLRASETTAGNDVELRAGLLSDTGDINLVSANDTAYSLTEQYKKKIGLSTSGGFVSIASAKGEKGTGKGDRFIFPASLCGAVQIVLSSLTKLTFSTERRTPLCPGWAVLF
nr:hemagglutinin repeat-containing protein [Stutzerimonas stutzeri]